MKTLKTFLLFTVVVASVYYVKINLGHWIGPKLDLSTDLYDFGSIEEGKTAQYYIKFKNNGRLPLKLTGVFSDCGCTVVDWSDEKIPSGQMDSILVEYDTKKVGLINRIVTINSNSADSPHAFYIIGNVRQSILINEIEGAM